MKKIALSGTHGVGKTTLAHQICIALKELQVNSTVIEEKARSCPFPINEKATVDTEIWMVHTQIRSELEAKAKRYEAAIIDRCSLDAIVYWYDRNVPNLYFESLQRAALQWLEMEYDLLILVEPSSDTDPFAVDAVRDSSIEYRNRIRDLFREYISRLSESFKERVMVVESDEIFCGKGYSVASEKVLEYLDLTRESKQAVPVGAL